MTQPAQLPLNIGITGHRDLVSEETPALKELVRDWFTSLAERYPELQLNVLTSLAAGADTLVADVAQDLGLKITVVLPMPYALYVQDFDDTERAAFERHYQANDVIELPLLADNQNAPNRDLQYEHLGSFLASHSHILLALWDGKTTAAIGGTWQVIDFHQRNISALTDQAPRSRLDVRDDESDLVYHVVCSRRSNGAPASGLTPCTASWFTRDDTVPRTSLLPDRYHQVFTAMSQFNRDSLAMAHRISYDEPLAETESSEDACAELQKTYATADSLARIFQSRVLLALRATIGLALCAGLCFILYADLPNQEHMIWGYLVCVFGALACFWLAQRRDWQRRHLDYRVLAEALRVQHYWALADVTAQHTNQFSHDYFFEGRDLQLGWIRNAMRHTGLLPDASLRPTHEDLQSVISAWVGTHATGQLGYYRTRAGERLKRHNATQRATAFSFAAGLLAATALAFGASELGPNLGNGLVALMGLLPIMAAARQNYAHRLAERELVAQYAHMQQVFESAHRLLQRSDDTAEQRAILRDLGESALQENASWVLRQRERPLPGGDAMT